MLALLLMSALVPGDARLSGVAQQFAPLSDKHQPSRRTQQMILRVQDNSKCSPEPGDKSRLGVPEACAK